MKYEKPEVVVLPSTVNAVQSSEKNGRVGDNNTHTIPAYEADE